MKNFEEPDNCDPVLLCTSTDMETIWAWCVVACSSIFLDTDSVEGKGKKTSRFCVIERESSNKLYELGCFPVKPTRITKKLSFGQHQAPSLYKFSSLIQDLGCG